MGRRSPVTLLLPILLCATAVFPLRAENLDLFTSAIRMARDRYLYPEAIVSEKMLEAAVLHLTDEIEWLLAEVDGNQATLRIGDGTLLGTVSVGGVDDLPRALAEVARLVRGQPRALEDGFDLDVEILRGAFGSLDPHSVILAGERLESFDQRLKGTLSGIGCRIGVENGEVVVKEIFPGAPAEEGGLREGDLLVRIDDVSCLGMGVSDASDRLRGPAGTQVRVRIRRGDRELDLVLVRAEVKIPNLDSRVLTSGVGYVHISNFSEQTVENLRKALAELGSRGALERGLILDLRGNSGGSMIQGARTADQFLVEGELIRTVGRDAEPVPNLLKEMFADDEGTEPAIPLAVLVDERSASASEITSGALKLLDRAILVGQRTYGKGTVQRVFNLRADVRLKLTVAQYLLVGDVSVAGQGLDPDVPVAWSTFDRNGLRLTPPRGDGLVPPVDLVDERPGWRTGTDDVQAREDPELELAERVVLAARGPHRDDILAAARKVVPQVIAEEEARRVATFRAGGIDWTPAPSDGPSPDVRVTLQTDGPPRAGEAVSVRARVDNRGATALHRVRVVIHSENSIWDGIVLPVGRIDPGRSGEGRFVVQLKAGLPDRVDQVTVVAEADRCPSALPTRQFLSITSRPLPSLAVEGRLVPAADGLLRAELTLENEGRESLSELRVRFDFPADEAIELVDREGFVPALGAGQRRRVDLDLRTRPTFTGSALPLELKVEAQHWGTLAMWEFPLPLDGSPRSHHAPVVRFQGPLQVPANETVHLTLKTTDDGPIDHVVTWVNGRKSSYVPGGRNHLDTDIRFPVVAGSNKVVALAEDAEGHRTRAVAWVLGLGDAEGLDITPADTEDAPEEEGGP